MNARKIEKKYISIYAKTRKIMGQTVYYDDFVYDKYMHNFLVLKKQDKAFFEKISKLYNDNRAFSQYRVEFHFQSDFYDFLGKCEIDHLISYKALIDKLNVMKKRENEARKLDVDDYFILFERLFNMSKEHGENFARRSAMNYIFKALIEKKTSFYGIFEKEVLVGTIEVFEYKNAIKVEEFVIDDDYQKKGYGSTLLRKVLDDAKAKGLTEVYLTADFNDTPKEMYEKMGFSLQYDYFFIRKLIK